jgi:hypothetical protein
MALFTAAVTAVTTAIKALTLKAVVVGAAKFIGTTLLASGVSRLMAKRQLKSASSGGFGGGRIQLPPATDNKIPVIYGSAFVGGPVIDAKISTDQKTMWYVIALAEHTDSTVGSGYTFGVETYYDGKLVNFGVGAAVASLQNNNEGTPQVDTKVAGNLFIYFFNNGSSSGVNTGGQTAIQILSDASIPVAQRWTATDTMTNCAFAIVKVIYNADAGTTNLGSLTVRLVNNLTKPGEVLKDYMLNTRYGCAIPLSRIDTDSLDDLDDYSDELITYVPVGGGSATQPRYRINGPIDTANDCLTNLQILVDGCDSWLQYSEMTGKWKVVINQSYLDYTTFNDLFVVSDSNLISGIQINPIDLNQTYNELEVAYPNFYIKDQTDYQTIKLSDYLPGIMSPNEAVNRLNIDLPVVNEAIQAKYIGLRRLLESREDLTISFQMDYSGIQIEAGDVIRVNSTVYGWTDKLFRVANVAEEKYPDGTLGSSVQAFEYNDTIYADNSIQDFIPAFNTGLTDPNILSQPGTPVFTINPPAEGEVQSFNVTSTVSTTGTVLYMDFNYGATSNVATHRLYRTVSKSDGTPFTAGDTVRIDVNDAGPATYYASVTGRNDQVGVSSNASNAFVWGGMNLTEANTWPGCNANSSGTLVTLNSISNLSLSVGGIVTITSGTGTLAANTVVANVVSNTQFNLSAVPTVALSNACIAITAGGITGNNIQANTVTFTNLAPAATGEPLGGYQWSAAVGLGNTAVTIPTRNITSFGSNIANANFDAIYSNTGFTQPVYISNVYSGGGGYYPFYQGTSNVADFYQANSTGSLQPAGADLLYLVNGDINWWVTAYDKNSSNVSFGFNEKIEYTTQVVTDTDTVVQFMPFVTTSTFDPDEFIADTETMYTYPLAANVPTRVEFGATYLGSNSFSITGGGVVMRLLSSGNVTMVNGTLVLSKTK